MRAQKRLEKTKFELFIRWIIEKLYYIFSVFLFRQELEVVSLEICSEDICSEFDGKKIVLLSDFHHSPTRSRLAKWIISDAVKVSVQEDPDYVFLLGDFIHELQEGLVELYERWLSKLTAKEGIYAVMGNADAKREGGQDFIMNYLKSKGIIVLDDEKTSPCPNVEFVGIGTFYKSFEKEKYLDSLVPVVPQLRVVLAHDPEIADLIAKKGIKADYIFSGHTHGSQFRTPSGRPLLPYTFRLGRYLPIFRKVVLKQSQINHWEWHCGYHRVLNSVTVKDDVYENVKDNMVFVTKGLGTHSPFRLNCPPDISIITFHKKKDEKTEPLVRRMKAKEFLKEKSE